MSELSLIGLKKVFEKGTPNAKVALDHVNLEVAPGDFITILGSNGAGLALGLNIYFLLHGMPYFAFWGISRRKTFPRIERMLSENLPVILSIGNNLPRFWRRQKLALYQENPDGTMRVHSRTRAHFVTVTEMNEEWMGVSTWGKKLYISREEWEDYVSRYSCAPLSNILVIHRLGKKK